MIRCLVVVGSCVAAILLCPAPSSAMSCAQSPLDEVISEADAVFAGTLTGVRRLRLTGFRGSCAGPSAGKRCGSKIGTVSVSKIWKGDPGGNASVYSEDACSCLGSYFAVGAEMLFVVVRDTDRHDADYKTAFCVRTVPLETARQEGTLDELDKLLVPSEPAE